MARRYADLFSKVVSLENLWKALRKAKKGKRGHPEVAAFEFHAEEHLVRLREELLKKKYFPGPYRSFFIQDPKRRLISAAPFRDRVVHHALCNVTEPIFERTFIGDSYANRQGKGTHKALGRAQAFSRRFRRFGGRPNRESPASWCLGIAARGVCTGTRPSRGVAAVRGATINPRRLCS